MTALSIVVSYPTCAPFSTVNGNRRHVVSLMHWLRGAVRLRSPEAERYGVNRGNLLLAIHRDDARILKELFRRNHIITGPHTYAGGQPRTASGLCVGAVLDVRSSNPFNIHGLQQFLTEAWQPIIERVSRATLRAVGSVPLLVGADVVRVVCVGGVSDRSPLARAGRDARVTIHARDLIAPETTAQPLYARHFPGCTLPSAIAISEWCHHHIGGRRDRLGYYRRRMRLFYGSPRISINVEDLQRGPSSMARVVQVTLTQGRLDHRADPWGTSPVAFRFRSWALRKKTSTAGYHERLR